MDFVSLGTVQKFWPNSFICCMYFADIPKVVSKVVASKVVGQGGCTKTSDSEENCISHMIPKQYQLL